MKKGYIIATMVWLAALFAVMAITDLAQSPGFSSRLSMGLDGGVVFLGALALIIIGLLALALNYAKNRPQEARVTIRICMVVLILYAIAGIFSIGLYIAPAAYLLYLATADGGQKKVA